MDDRIRGLERQAAAGDPAALEALWQSKRRMAETAIIPCPECNGQGKIVNFAIPSVTSYYGSLTQPERIECSDCNGYGQVRVFLENIPIYRPNKR